MARACLLGIRTELLRLLGRLSASPCDDKYILEPIIVYGGASETDRFLAFVVREMLGFAVAALNEYARDATLGKRVRPLDQCKIDI